MPHGVDISEHQKREVIDFRMAHPLLSVDEISARFDLHRNTIGRIISEWYASEEYETILAEASGRLSKNILKGIKSRNREERLAYSRLVANGIRAKLLREIKHTHTGEVRHQIAFDAAVLPAAERNERWRNVIAVAPFGRG